MPEDYATLLLPELATHSATDVRVERDHKHPQIGFVHAGRKLIYVIPSTPSDRRGALNALSDLRNLLGVRRIIHKSSGPPKRRNRTEAPVVLTFAARPDPMAALAGVAARMRQKAEAAGLAAYMAGASDAAPRGLDAASFRAGWWRGHGGWGG